MTLDEGSEVMLSKEVMIMVLLSNKNFNSTIDNVRIPRARSASGASNTQCYSAYNYARTQEQVEKDYNKGSVRIG